MKPTKKIKDKKNPEESYFNLSIKQNIFVSFFYLKKMRNLPHVHSNCV